MPNTFSIIKSLVLIIAGLVGFYLWFRGGYSRDAGYGIFMLSVVGILAGVQIFLKSFGIDVFGRDGTGDAGNSWLDGDGDGGD
jgi:hypothetical protein